MGKERVEYLDAIKGYSIILVVFCHYVFLPKTSVLGNVLMTMAWGAVPCFFMVTGGLMHQKTNIDWKKHFKKIAKLYFVVCAWKVIYLFYYGIIEELKFSKIEFLKYVFMFQEIEKVNTGLMWFMYAYLAAMIFFPISLFIFQGRKSEKNTLFFLIVLLFGTGIFPVFLNFIFEIISDIGKIGVLEFSGILKVLPFSGYSNMLFYFIIGALLFEYKTQIKLWLNVKKERKFIPLFLMCVGMIGLIMVKFFYTRSFLWNDYFLPDGYRRISTIFFSLGMYLMIQYYSKNKINSICAKYIGKNTMGIFYLHFLVLEWYYQHYHERIQQYYSVGLNIIKTCIVIAICIAITNILKKIPLLRELVK